MADIRKLDLPLLKAFEALMEEGNVTRAAARLAVTQPAVSGMLTRLREAFGDPLFVRAQRGIVATPRAQALAPAVRRVLADIERLLQPGDFDPATTRMTLTLAATDYALRAIVVPFMQALREQAPHARVAVRTIDDQSVATQLERGDIDLALVTPQHASPDLHARHLFDETYVCALRSDHPDAQRRSLSLDRFCALDHALVTLSGDAFRGVTDVALEKIDRQRRVALSVQSFLVLPEVLKHSDLVAVVPRRLAQGMDGLRLMEAPVEIPGFSKLLVWHERSHQDPGHAWMRQTLAAACGEPPSVQRKVRKPAAPVTSRKASKTARTTKGR